jgi:AcrR family transcriptional regulator
MSKGEATRGAVLATALDLASQHGLAGVSIGRLAECCGMSKSGLFAHFSSKEKLEVEILREAMDRFVNVVISPALKAKRGEPRVLALFDRWLAWVDELRGGCIFAAAAVELDDKPGPARDLLVSSQKDWLETLATAARIAVDEGHFRADLEPDQFAHEIYCLGFGHHSLSRLVRDPQFEQRTRRTFERIVRDARRSKTPSR